MARRVSYSPTEVIGYPQPDVDMFLGPQLTRHIYIPIMNMNMCLWVLLPDWSALNKASFSYVLPYPEWWMVCLWLYYQTFIWSPILNGFADTGFQGSLYDKTSYCILQYIPEVQYTQRMCHLLFPLMDKRIFRVTIKQQWLLCMWFCFMYTCRVQ